MIPSAKNHMIFFLYMSLPFKNNTQMLSVGRLFTVVTIVNSHNSRLTQSQYTKPTNLILVNQNLLSSGPLKIPSLSEVALETERRCFSKVILESNVTPNITRSLDSFSIVLPIANGVTGDALCMTCRLS